MKHRFRHGRGRGRGRRKQRGGHGGHGPHGLHYPRVGGHNSLHSVSANVGTHSNYNINNHSHARPRTQSTEAVYVSQDSNVELTTAGTRGTFDSNNININPNQNSDHDNNSDNNSNNKNNSKKDNSNISSRRHSVALNHSYNNTNNNNNNNNNNNSNEIYPRSMSNPGNGRLLYARQGTDFVIINKHDNLIHNNLNHNHNHNHDDYNHNHLHNQREFDTPYGFLSVSRANTMRIDTLRRDDTTHSHFTNNSATNSLHGYAYDDGPPVADCCFNCCIVCATRDEDLDDEYGKGNKGGGGGGGKRKGNNKNSKNNNNNNNNRDGFYDSICNRFPVFNPVGPCRIGWDFIVTIVLLYTCIEIPYTLAFGIDLSLTHWSGQVAFGIDIFLLLDVCVHFRTAYFDSYDNLHLITSPKRIAIKLSIFFFAPKKYNVTKKITG